MQRSRDRFPDIVVLGICKRISDGLDVYAPEGRSSRNRLRQKFALPLHLEMGDVLW